MEPRTPTDREMPACPAGGPEHGPPNTCVRQGRADMTEVYPHLHFKPGTVTGVSDVGWRCRQCATEWGFEVLTDDYLEAVRLLTGEAPDASR